MIFLLFVFSCNIMNSNIEGAENYVKLTKEEKDDIDKMCKDAHYKQEIEINKCIGKRRERAQNKKIADKEAQQMKDDLNISAPGGECPKVSSFYNLFAKAYCIAINIRRGAQDI